MTDSALHHRYRGRFAPSPTGPLHFGSLVTALGSYLRAKSLGGEWLVRMEDLDPPREQPGAADDILRMLETYGLLWDGPVIYQSQRHMAYAEALATLTQQQHTFPCGCSRKQIAEAIAETMAEHSVYPGTCRNGLPAGMDVRALRLRVPVKIIQFEDLLQGTIRSQLDTETGDFVIKRADGFYAYHLAVVVDDAEQGITEIVRGADLLDATPPQIFLQELLGYDQPGYLHLPIAVNAQGEKLSKQTYAAPLEMENAGPTLVRALDFLGQNPEKGLANEMPQTILDWATQHWNLKTLPTTRQIQI